MRALVWTKAARADLARVIDHYAETDPRVGHLLVDRIERAAGKLRRFDTGRPSRVEGAREKSVAMTKHILVYEVHPDRVVVFRVVHTSQDWPKRRRR